MSLAVLAKKSKHYTNRVSGCGQNGFSLNGGYRNQGWVGQDMFGRTLIGTPFRGSEPIGHGGKNGTYTTTVINRSRPCTNDPGIIKRSNMNTPGYISSRLVPRGAPCEEGVYTRCGPVWVQRFDPDDHAQSEYIRRLHTRCASVNWPKSGGTQEPYASTAGSNTCEGVPCRAASYFIGGRKVYRAVFTKSLPDFPLTCGEYTKTRLMIVRHLPTPPCAVPWPTPIARDAQCKGLYVTPQAGYRAGLLPEEWSNGGRTKMIGWNTQAPADSDGMEEHFAAENQAQEDAETGDGAIGVTTTSLALKAWAKGLFVDTDDDDHAVSGAGPSLARVRRPPPPPPVQQRYRPYVGPRDKCRRTALVKTSAYYYKSGSGTSVGVGGSCNPGAISAKSRRLGGKLNPTPTIIFRNVPKT